MRRRVPFIPVKASVKFGLAVTLVLPTTSCWSRSRTPNLLLVTIDTLRADHCSAYGYGRATTPRLDRLASEGALVETAYAPIPVTGPSHTSLMTGLYPRATGVVQNGLVLGEAPPTLAGLLSARGYSTAAVVSAFPLNRRFGLARGFQHYDDEFLRSEASMPDERWDGQVIDQAYDRRGDATTDRALAWLASRPSQQPFFLWVHYFDPHSPYEAPAGNEVPPSRGSAAEPEPMVAAYDNEIRFADGQLGRLLDALEGQGLGRNTLVVVTSDHGEGLGQHGVSEHGPVVYEEAVRVPLVFRWSGELPAGQRLKQVAQLIDVLPSVLDLLLPGGGPAVQGHSLADRLKGRPNADAAVPPVFLQREFEDQAGDNLFAVRDGDHKYIETRESAGVARREFYDLQLDPQELRSLDGEPSETWRPLAQRLRGWRSEVAPGARQRPNPEVLEGLRALGYLQ